MFNAECCWLLICNWHTRCVWSAPIMEIICLVQNSSRVEATIQAICRLCCLHKSHYTWNGNFKQEYSLRTNNKKIQHLYYFIFVIRLVLSQCERVCTCAFACSWHRSSVCMKRGDAVTSISFSNQCIIGGTISIVCIFLWPSCLYHASPGLATQSC
jgi:hypothetical protein